MIYKSLFMFLTLFSFNCFADHSGKKIVVVIPSYNNIDWYQNNLSTILKQDYDNFRVIYVDDCSKDGMGPAVDRYVRENVDDYLIADFDGTIEDSIEGRTESFSQLVNEPRHFFTVIHNVNRCGALENLYRMIQSCDDDEIVATVDGDDWLYRTDVLSELNDIYSTRDVWLTHGCIIEYPHSVVGWSISIPHEIVQNNAFRTFRCPSHLRTFYSGLFKKIKLEDLLFEGIFYQMTWDMAMMYPMIEMAGERHAFISKPSYVYNMANQINDNKVNAQLQRDLDALIRAKEPYQRIEQ